MKMVDEWKEQYREVLDRFKFLVLVGASRTGKSSLARSLGGVPFVQTVQSGDAPDLKAYDPAYHPYLVFDNVNDMSFVMNYRALFQANNDVHKLAESRRGMYSYEVHLWRVPIVFTVDHSARWDQDDPWISQNSVHILLDGPSWIK